MTLCNFSTYLNYESGIFNVNVYIHLKTEFKIVYFINVLTPGKRVYMHGSEFAYRCANFPIKFVFINPTFCVGSGVCLFQGRFCAYATVINEAQVSCSCAKPALQSIDSALTINRGVHTCPSGPDHLSAGHT